MHKSQKFENAEILLTIAFVYSGINLLLYRSLVGGIFFSFLFVCFLLNTYLYFHYKVKEKREK